MQVTKGTSHVCEQWATGGIIMKLRYNILLNRAKSGSIYRSKINCPGG